MSWQLLRATGDPRYAAMLHHHIYNHMLAAQHPDGINWCYMTTMEGKKAYGPAMHCCGSSGPRAIALIPTIAYMTAKDKLAINLYETSQFKGEVGGVDVTVRQQTDYPWDGRISIEVETAKPVSFDLQLLVPQFVQSGRIRVAGSKRKIPLEAGEYATIHRTWSGTTEVAIQFDMSMAVHEWKGRYALSRGPIILALEKVETEGASTQEVLPDASYLKQQGRTLAFEAGQRHPIHVKGRKISTTGGASSDVSLLYRPYCEAGASGENVCIWLPTPPVTGGKK